MTFKFINKKHGITITFKAKNYSQALEMVGIGYTLMSITK